MCKLCKRQHDLVDIGTALENQDITKEHADELIDRFLKTADEKTVAMNVDADWESERRG